MNLEDTGGSKISATAVGHLAISTPAEFDRATWDCSQHHEVITAVATIKAYEEENLIENAAKMGTVLTQRLAQIKSDYKLIGDVRNSGLFGCIELVQDRETKELIPAVLQDKIKPMLMAKGLSTLVKGHIILVAPPLIISEDELHTGLDLFD
ncbi:MAG: taurine--2-oxoglutarate transaminase [Cellvibrionaceae bacterium]|jgi:taurine--2-oxoglutarate transaminase